MNLNRSLRTTSPLVLLTCLLGVPGLALAQDQLMRPTTMPAYGRTMVGNADSTALVQNPANLAFLAGPELRWTGAFLDEDASSTAQGYSIGFALPFGFAPIATGLRFDMMNPTDDVTEATVGRSYNYQWLTWALAFGSETASLGFAYQASFSDVSEYHKMGSWNLGFNIRPADYFGLGGTIYNINSPKSDTGYILRPTYEMGLALRPTGTDAVELGLEAQYVDAEAGYWVPRAALDVAIPTLGRVRGDVSWIDPGQQAGPPSWIASTSLVLIGNSRQGSGELALGTRYGNALGGGNQPQNNLYLEAAFRGFRDTAGADNKHYAVRIRMESTPSNREHVALLRTLWRLADDERNLKAVLLELRASPANSLAHAQELKDAIYHLQNRGKQVTCHLESATGAALYLCAAADQLLINPAGDVRYKGLAADSYYLKGLLDHIGVRADFVRIGEHKSAPETLVRKEGSPTAVADRVDLLQQVELEINGGISRDRKQSLEQLRRTVEKGPFTAAEAKLAGLVDGFAFDDMLEEKVSALADDELSFEKPGRAKGKPERFGPTKRIAIVYVEGDMVDGRSSSIPFLNIHTAGSYTIAESLRQVREDPSVGAVVLRIETGGGSAMAADIIWREVQLTREKKPVVVSMGSAAASGGYYIASPGTYIFANPLSVTGSIGIFYGKVDVAGLLSRFGINVETLRTTKHADAEAPFRPFLDEEREVLKRKIEQYYSLFLQRVATGRGMTRAQVDAVGRGRVWTGRQAREHKLVDELGGLRQALTKARELARIRDDVPIIELPKPQQSLLGKLLGVEGLRAELGGKSEQGGSAVRPQLPQELLRAAHAIIPYTLYEEDQPLARIEVVPEWLP